MPKNFYFPLYVDDFVGGIKGMSCEEVGAYIQLLMYQFTNGSIPIDEPTRISTITGTNVNLDYVLKKFPNGVNAKLSKVIHRLSLKSEVGKENIAKRYQSDSKSLANSQQNDTILNLKSESLNLNNINIKEKKGFQPPTPLEILEYCKLNNILIDQNAFYHFYESKGWKVGNQPMKSWQSAIMTWKMRDTKKKDTSHETHSKIWETASKIKAIEEARNGH